MTPCHRLTQKSKAMFLIEMQSLMGRQALEEPKESRRPDPAGVVRGSPMQLAHKDEDAQVEGEAASQERILSKILQKKIPSVCH